MKTALPNKSQGISAFSVLLIMATLSVIGIALLPHINVQYSPTSVEHRISVSFSWPGTATRVVEMDATSRLEGALSVVKGCRGVSSRSRRGSGSITLNFTKETDMAAARFEVASIIRNIYTKLPEGVSYPSISLNTSGSRERSSLSYTIKAGIPAEQIYDFVVENVSTPLSRIEGVDKVNISGVTPFEWLITFNPEALEAVGLTANDLNSAFAAYFRNDIVGLTTIDEGDGIERSIVLKLRNVGSLDFDNIPITKRNDRLYYFRDFARAQWRESLPASYRRINGLNTVNLSITLEGHTNMLRVAESVRERMDELIATFPAEISAELSYDSSEYVRSELDKIYLRTLLCVTILLLFVLLVSRDVRYLVMITLTLAVNILVAVIFYVLFDVGIHIYSLAGITVSLGIIIDTAIIMVDHYSYYRNRRVFISILGALFTTIGALGVIWLLPESQRDNLLDFALVIVINLIVSLIVALLFVPALLDKVPLKRSMTSSSIKSRRIIVRITARYERFILWGRVHRWVLLVLLIWGFGMPFFLLPNKIETERNDEELPFYSVWYNKVMESKFIVENRATIDMIFGTSLNLFNREIGKYNYYREPARPELSISAGMPEGCTVQQLNDVVRHMENYLSQYDQIETFETNISSYNSASISVSFKPEWEHTPFPAQLKQEVIAAATNFGGATWRVTGVDDNYFNNNVTSTSMSNIIKLTGYNFDQLSAYAEQLMDSLRSNRRVSQVELMNGNSWSLPNTEFHIRYNKEQIAAGGLDIYDYYNSLHTMLYNSSLTSVYADDERQRVVMQSEGRDRYDKWYLENAQVEIDSLQMKLSAVGSIDKRRSDITINRSKQSYEVQIGFDFVGSYELCNRMINKTVKTFNDEILPLGFAAVKQSYSYGAAEKKTQIKLILLIIAIIYAMCAIIFESLRKPLVIIMMIPVSFIGVFLTFGLSGFRFDQGGFAAFVLLCGVVVNAGIYLISEYNDCREVSSQRGVRLYLKAYNHKIVPIMLTIISTILGLIPFLFDGPEEVFWFAFAIAAISGTLFSIIALMVYLPIFMPMDKQPKK
ncbi:MAG: efflux RND transporter permease subunit [Alistipes sp.]|nr:efflux RND transporter permease subunit [Alistipes sp.]